jgi:chromosome segregation ATPase
MIRHHLAENQALLRGLQDRLRRTEGHLEMYEQKREDLEAVLAQRNTAYEELLGEWMPCSSALQLTRSAARQSSGLVGTEVIAEIKVRLSSTLRALLTSRFRPALRRNMNPSKGSWR